MEEAKGIPVPRRLTTSPMYASNSESIYRLIEDAGPGGISARQIARHMAKATGKDWDRERVRSKITKLRLSKRHDDTMIVYDPDSDVYRLPIDAVDAEVWMTRMRWLVDLAIKRLVKYLDKQAAIYGASKAGYKFSAASRVVQMVSEMIADAEDEAVMQNGEAEAS